MGKGNDNVTITGLTVAGNAKLRGGKGNDTFTIAATSKFNSSLSVRLGKGNDVFSMDGTTVTGNTSIKAKSGDDKVTITNSTLAKLKGAMGSGDDNLGISGTTVSNETHLNGGKGTNTLSQGGQLARRPDNKALPTELGTAVSLDTIAAQTENNPVTLTGNFVDTDVSDTHSLTIDWADPNKSADSTFAIPATTSLTANQTITSSTGDGAVLKILTASNTTGLVTFSVQHTYVDDGAAGSAATPGNNTASDPSTVTATITDSGILPGTDTTTITVNNGLPTGVVAGNQHRQ